jgi:hypothetical protein
MDVSAIALQGVQQAEAKLESIAASIASSAAASPGGANLDTANLSAEMLALMSAQNQASANLTTLKAADEIQQTVLDVMA